MTKYLKEYMECITKQINELPLNSNEIALIIDKHRTMITFMQHERLIHFLVTMLVALLFFITLGILAVTEKTEFLPVAVLLLGLTVPYIKHYFFLENTVQKMYIIHDSLAAKKDATKEER